MAFIQQRAGRAKLLLSRGARMCAMGKSDIKFDPSVQQELRPLGPLLNERHFFGGTYPTTSLLSSG